MNFIDLLTGYMMKSGTIVQWHPFAGLRGGWINQRLTSNYTANFVNGGGYAGSAQGDSHTSSWAIGPRIGLDVDLDMGYNLSFYGTTAGDILYTSYKFFGSAFATVPATATLLVATDWIDIANENQFGTIRTHLDLELGFRWSRYFFAHKQLLQLSGGYGFQVYFDQNMFRHLTTAFEEIVLTGGVATLGGIIGSPISTSPEGNLYLHGLRLEAKYSY